MSEEKRMIESYEVKNAILIGGKEIILAEDMGSKEPYMVCNCQWDNPLGIDVYDKGVTGADYLEAMTEFLSRVSSEVQRIQDQRAERGVSNEPLTAADCIPGSKDNHYENQLVVIRPEVMVASMRTADEQLFLATSGFGCNPGARGQAVYCKNLFTGKTVRWERHDIAGIILPERVPAWAHQRLAEKGKEVYLNSDRKPYCVHMGHLGEGLTVWNTLEEVNGDYMTIARIGSDRSVQYLDDNLPPAVKVMIEKTARTSEMTVSATQDAPVFSTPPQGAPEQSTPGMVMPEPVKPADIAVYKQPFAYAREHDELDQFHQGRELNAACAAAIDKAVNESRYDTHCYNLKAAAKKVIAEFGAERVDWVLANTIQKWCYDGRYSDSNKKWARGYDIPSEASSFICNTHPYVLDGFIDCAREAAVASRPSALAALKAKPDTNRQQPTPRKAPKKAKQEEL